MKTNITILFSLLCIYGIYSTTQPKPTQASLDRVYQWWFSTAAQRANLTQQTYIAPSSQQALDDYLSALVESARSTPTSVPNSPCSELDALSNRSVSPMPQVSISSRSVSPIFRAPSAPLSSRSPLPSIEEHNNG